MATSRSTCLASANAHGILSHRVACRAPLAFCNSRALSRSSPQRRVIARASDEETKEQVAGILKTGVRGVAWGVDQATELAYKYAPDDWEKTTVALLVKVAAATLIFSIAKNVLSFAFTLGAIAVVAIIAIQVLELDVNDILDSAKSKTKK